MKGSSVPGLLLTLALTACGSATPPAAAPSSAAAKPATSTAAVPASVSVGASARPSGSASASGKPAASPAAASGSAAGASAPTSTEKPERERIKLTYATAGGGQTFARLASEKGLFKKYGLDVEVQFAQSNVSMAALTAGEVQLDLTAGVDVIQAISGGAPLKLIGYFDNHSPYGIFALADIKEPADLKGKTVAVGKIGDTSDVGLRIGLKQLGLSANDVKLLQTGNSPERWAALTSKQVQGAILDADTFAKLAEAQGVRMLLNMKPQPYVATALVIQDSFGKSNPRTIDASLRGLIDGVKYFADPKNESEVKAALGRELKREVSDPQVAATYESVTGRLSPDPFPEQAGVDAILGALRDIDPRYGSLTAGQIIDASYMQRVRGTK